MSALVGENKRLARRARALKRQIARCSRERARLARRVGGAEAAAERAALRCAEIEERSQYFAGLYVMSQRLAGARTREEACRAIQDIAASLIGSEELALFAVDSAGVPTLVAAYGVDPAPFAADAAGHRSLIAHTARAGVAYFQRAAARRADAARPGGPCVRGDDDIAACLPLKVDERIVGIAAIFRLLPQKPALSPLDIELLSDLAALAAAPFAVERRQFELAEAR